MKHRFTIFLLLLSSVVLSATAQNATNVRVRQEGETIVITYDLDKKANVRIWVAIGQSNQYTELKAVTGSIGKDISAGVNKQIIWQPLQEQTEFVAQNVRFKVEATSVQYYFSVGKNRRVAFSPGNLQYRASTNTWRFAPHQYDYIGAANANISNTYNGWIDLFGWETGNNPTKSSKTSSDYQTFIDWGVNKIGGDACYEWHTLSIDEWFFLFFTRPHATKLFGFGTIRGIKGVIILPDNWLPPKGIAFTCSAKGVVSKQKRVCYFRHGDSYAHNHYTITEWQEMESAGAIFLPAAGCRGEYDFVEKQNNCGVYWSCTPRYAGTAYIVWLDEEHLFVDGNGWRSYGNSVRLVKDM